MAQNRALHKGERAARLPPVPRASVNNIKRELHWDNLPGPLAEKRLFEFRASFPGSRVICRGNGMLFFFHLVKANNQSGDTATVHLERAVKSEL